MINVKNEDKWRYIVDKRKCKQCGEEFTLTDSEIIENVIKNRISAKKILKV